MRPSSPYDAQAEATLVAVQQYLEATNRHDVDAMMAAMTDDCVFENTTPPPDGKRYEGQAAVREATEKVFHDAPDAVFETEDIFAAEDRAIVRWLYRWAPDEPGKPGHVRGVDVIRVREGKVAETLAYVKG